MPPKFQDLLKEQRSNPETAKAGLKWEESDDQVLLEQVGNDVPFSDIAKNLQRTVGSVKTRLIIYALNKIENENEPLEQVAESVKLLPKDITEYQRKKKVREEKRLQRIFTKKQNRNNTGNSGVSLDDVHNLLLDIKSELEKLTS